MIVLDNDSNVPLYLQIYEQIKQKIILGQILEGSKLTSTRTLSTTLNVSRNTVESAYLQLCSEGYISSKIGSGFIVEKLDGEIISKLKEDDFINTKEHKKIVTKKNSSDNLKYNFRYGNLSSSDFPLNIWKKLSNKCLSALSAEEMMSYTDGKGELGLRIEIMKYLNRSRGVSCNPEQIVVCSGMESCINLLCQLLRDNFDQIALEDPGYVGARSVFINNGYKVNPIGLDNDGINIKELEDSSAKIVYVTPSHQFPTGAVMPIQKRLKLLDWAIRKNGIIIEDDYDSELRYNSRPIPSIQSIDSKGHVVYIGTFSKSLSPNLRVNYMMLPQSYLERYDKIFNKYKSQVPLVLQKIIQQFMYLGHWERHLRKICITNKKKHDLMVNTIYELMGDNVVIHGKNAGLHILLEFSNGLCEDELIKKAERNDITVSPVSPFWVRQDNYGNNMVLLSFGGMSENEITEGIKKLNDAWFKKEIIRCK